MCAKKSLFPTCWLICCAVAVTVTGFSSAANGTAAIGIAANGTGTVATAAAGTNTVGTAKMTFTKIRLKPEGAPDLEVFDDIDGDGRTDILLCDNRVFSVFLQGEGRFPVQPSFLIQAPEEAVFLDVANPGGAQQRDPVFLSRKGVFRLVRESGAFTDKAELLLEHENPFLPPRVKKLAFLDFLRDITLDGIEDLIIPELERYVVYQGKGDGTFTPWSVIPFEPRSDFYTEVLSQTGRLKEVVHLPRLFTGKSGSADVVIHYDGTWVSILERAEDGAMQTLSRKSLYKPDSREYEEASRTYFGKSVFFEDLSGEGSNILIISENRNGMVKFFSGGDLRRPFREALTIRTDGWILNPVFKDLNSDGRKDLILPTIEKIGIITILRIFFTSSFDIRYMIFLNRREPLYTLQPDIMRTVSLPLSFSAGPEGINVQHSLIYTFEGDFNGDGINDFLLKSAPRKLGIFYGVSGGGFSEAPSQTLDFEPLPRCSSTGTRVQDLNGDGASDLFVHQQSIEKGEDRYELYITTKGGSE